MATKITTNQELIDFLSNIPKGKDFYIAYETNVQFPAKERASLPTFIKSTESVKRFATYENIQRVKDYKADREAQGNPVKDTRNMKDYEYPVPQKVKRKISTNQHYVLLIVGSGEGGYAQKDKVKFRDTATNQEYEKDDWYAQFGDKLPKRTYSAPKTIQEVKFENIRAIKYKDFEAIVNITN